MGYYVLHDAEAGRAIVFDGTSEQPLRNSTFMGTDAREQAQSFLGWLLAGRGQREDGDLHPPTRSAFSDRIYEADPTDPRWHSQEGLGRMKRQWSHECLDEHERLNDYGWKLLEWFEGTQREDAPEPEVEAVEG